MSNTEHAQGSEEASGNSSDVSPEVLGAHEMPPVRRAQGLERLKERVETAARELVRLKKDNAVLARRLAELESRPFLDEEGTVIRFDEDTDALRARIDDFIQVIDAYLVREREGGVGE